MKIYLADLVYDTVETNHVVPLNVGYIAAYLKEKLFDTVEIQIFKYPKKLEKAIKDSPPDILGLSHYGWNEKLNNIFFSMTKRLNPNVVNVIGGPNIRHEREDIKEFLSINSYIDYCIMFEGEKSFYELVNNILNANVSENIPKGCATLLNNTLIYEPSSFVEKSNVLELPSPYLSGVLDEFIKQSNMIPLFESNRGCPYGCTYCAWGVSALSKIKKRPLSTVLEELEYVAEHSAGQVNWIFTDANFGILERDVDIAKKISSIKKIKGFPVSVTLWHSKNTSERNIEISKILDDASGYIAIQSSDKEVLKKSGRGKIQFEHLKKQIKHYKDQNLNVQTDILIGLPGDTKESHLQTLHDSFTLGFDEIAAYNIRMLKGTDYDSSKYREEYGITTKFRPIFGGYGIYDDKIVFEIEESVRTTSSMTEEELDKFKIIHWLIYFAWNSAIFAPILRMALKNGINPIDVMNEVIETNNVQLRDIFKQMGMESMTEWFDTSEEMIDHYQNMKNYKKLESEFVKLNFLWIARFLEDKEKLILLKNEFYKVITNELKNRNMLYTQMDELIKISDELISLNLLQEVFENKLKVNGQVLEYIMNDEKYSNLDSVDIIIYRTEEDVSFCKYNLNKDEKEYISLQRITSFLEMGGLKLLKNRIKVIN